MNFILIVTVILLISFAFMFIVSKLVNTFSTQIVNGSESDCLTYLAEFFPETALSFSRELKTKKKEKPILVSKREQFLILSLLTASGVMLFFRYSDDTAYFLVGSLYLASVILMTLSLIDIRYKILPDYLLFMLVSLGLLINLIEPICSLQSSVIGILVGFYAPLLLSLILSRFFGLNPIGLGDVKLFAAIGAIIGYAYIVQVVALSMLVGIIINGVTRCNREFAFGQCISIAAVAVFTFNHFFSIL